MIRFCFLSLILLQVVLKISKENKAVEKINPAINFSTFFFLQDESHYSGIC